MIISLIDQYFSFNERFVKFCDIYFKVMRFWLFC